MASYGFNLHSLSFSRTKCDKMWSQMKAKNIFFSLTTLTFLSFLLLLYVNGAVPDRKWS